MPDRRQFLATLAAAFVAPDPERLLWTPGKKLISIPKPAPISLTWIRYFDVVRGVWVNRVSMDGRCIEACDDPELPMFPFTPWLNVASGNILRRI